MPGIAVKSLDSAGGAHLAGGQDWMTVEDQLVVVLGDPVTPHGDPPHSPLPIMVEGSEWFLIDGVPVCRAGHRASCGHASSGRDWFLIDE
ncbi:PAAR domain-containing protein [Ancylobacter sp. A5.8]|uniref:PAAR domain-containing protein n=1 Tax=Ancylobacter gelatini TaxID=2919920 RepID=UPI001F4DA7E5|nr:PAAR domain-containing protein [Ancylobacter gelatini]MCJ8142976.1 PAAR domain-containing protein [Ancylobacter gelatini]